MSTSCSTFVVSAVSDEATAVCAPLREISAPERATMKLTADRSAAFSGFSPAAQNVLNVRKALSNCVPVYLHLLPGFRVGGKTCEVVKVDNFFCKKQSGSVDLSKNNGRTVTVHLYVGVFIAILGGRGTLCFGCQC